MHSNLDSYGRGSTFSHVRSALEFAEPVGKAMYFLQELLQVNVVLSSSLLGGPDTARLIAGRRYGIVLG